MKKSLTSVISWMQGEKYLLPYYYDVDCLVITPPSSLDVDSSPEVAPACTGQETLRHPDDDDDECKTTPISFCVETNVEANNSSSSPDEWVFPRLIKTTPIRTSPAPPPPSTLGPLDHKKLEKWVISKLFQDNTSECSEAALEDILPGLVDKPIQDVAVFSPPSSPVGVVYDNVEAVVSFAAGSNGGSCGNDRNDGSMELQPTTAATRCKEVEVVDEVAASVSSTRESDNSSSSSSSSFLSATASSSRSSNSTRKDTNTSSNATATTAAATKSLAAIKKRAPTATSKTALPRPNSK